MITSDPSLHVAVNLTLIRNVAKLNHVHRLCEHAM